MEKEKIILVAQNEKTNGLIGLVNCIRKEPNGTNVRCIFIDDFEAPEFDQNIPFYKSHIKLGLAMNVYKNGMWGSFMHLQLKQQFETKPVKEHCYANALTKGDLTSMTWLRGPFNDAKPSGEMVMVKYASLNFRDVMLATGKLNIENFGTGRLDQDCVLGFEYSGITASGRRVMGMVRSAAMSNFIEKDEMFTWDCPKEWSLEEAASIPVVYGTVYSAFFVSARIAKGNTILIHAGSGGVGLAAIRVALAYGLEVFTTVSTVEKKKFLLRTFPKLKECNIGNSRDTTFEQMVHYQTNGKGVNYVLNSLAGEKLQASIRCLGSGGVFLEIGKFDLTMDTKIGLRNFLKELSFHVVLIDNLFFAGTVEKEVLKSMVSNDINSGIIKPLPTTIFEANQIEQAFRYLASGKHVGKVLLQIRKNETDAATLPISVVSKAYCNPNYSYIVPGGLGGFGLELVDWLILRGCRKVVLSSTRGISNNYQDYRIKVWATYGVKTLINTSNIATYKGCEQLIRAAMELGPVGGVFNLAVALRDGILENLDVTKFNESLGPKAFATKYLDEISRKLCPNLHYFVVFSSVSCGRGNAGQTNYGMANSVMERIVEQRHEDGLPGKAIQWGAVGEVGLLAELQGDKMELEISGTLQQRISSCLEELDTLLTVPAPVVASMVVAEKKASAGGTANIVEAIMNIMGIRDIKSISMDTSLSLLGLDSLMGVEIKQTLERDFEIFLSPKEMRALTFLKLKELSSAKDSKNQTAKESDTVPTGQVTILLNNLGNESTSNQTILKLNDYIGQKNNRSCALIIPGIEGMAGNNLFNLASKLDMPAFALQLNVTGTQPDMKTLANEVFENVCQLYKAYYSFFLVGYSFGGVLAIELAGKLEKIGLKGHLVLLDSSPGFCQKLIDEQLRTLELNFAREHVINKLQMLVIASVTPIISPNESSKLQKAVLESSSWMQCIDKLVDFPEDHTEYSIFYLKNMINALYVRLSMVTNLNLKDVSSLNSPITLIRPKEITLANTEEDYGLSKHAKGKLAVKFVEGNHVSMLNNINLPDILKSIFITLQNDKEL